MDSQTARPGPSKLLYFLAGFVGLCAAAASFTGLYELALDGGYLRALAPTLPACVDVYTMAATIVWLSPRTPTRRGRAWARASAVIGIVFSMAGNSLSHAIAAHLLTLTWWQLSAVASVPPLSLALITHLVFVARDAPDADPALTPEAVPVQAPVTSALEAAAVAEVVVELPVTAKPEQLTLTQDTIDPPARESVNQQYARLVTARQIAAAHLERTGQHIGRPALYKALQDRNYPIGTKTADALVKQIRAELTQPQPPVLHAVG
jgi:hypothetical protein